MAVEAFAIEEKGSLLVDTVRYRAEDAWDAAIRAKKRPGTSRKSLDASGCKLVRVYVQVSGQGPADMPPRRYVVPPYDMSPGSRADLRAPRLRRPR
jgi:hypothetical protein